MSNNSPKSVADTEVSSVPQKCFERARKKEHEAQCWKTLEDTIREEKSNGGDVS